MNEQKADEDDVRSSVLLHRVVERVRSEHDDGVDDEPSDASAVVVGDGSLNCEQFVECSVDVGRRFVSMCRVR